MTAEGEIPRWQRYVPRACSDEDLQALRSLLAGYDTSQGTIFQLFHECFWVSEEELPAGVLDCLERLGLIARDTVFPGLIYATAAILPVSGELIVCDRGGAPDGSDYPLQPDTVYPPIFDNTRWYLARLPATPCDAMLEMGTGSGIGAIMGARHARCVWATDIADRAVQFARLNCRLAGLDNVTVVEGDLYSPVEGLTFDRIVFHPPWVPRLQSAFVFGDGGEDGEAIIRGSIEGLPRFLRPGGRFYAIVLASDREGERFEQRVRRWLGAAGSPQVLVDKDRFDVAFAELARDSPDGFLAHNLARGSISERDIPLWTELWKATRTEAMVFGHLVVERHEGEREAVTSRGTS